MRKEFLSFRLLSDPFITCSAPAPQSAYSALGFLQWFLIQELGARGAQISQLHRNWLCDPWRPVGAAAASRNLCPSLTRIPLLLSTSLPRFSHPVPESLGSLLPASVWDWVSLPGPTLRSSDREEAGWVALVTLGRVYLTGRGQEDWFPSHLGKRIIFSISPLNGNL